MRVRARATIANKAIKWPFVRMYQNQDGCGYHSLELNKQFILSSHPMNAPNDDDSTPNTHTPNNSIACMGFVRWSKVRRCVHRTMCHNCTTRSKRVAWALIFQFYFHSFDGRIKGPVVLFILLYRFFHCELCVCVCDVWVRTMRCGVKHPPSSVLV